MNDSKYFFLETDLFFTFRVFIISTLILVSVLIFTTLSLWYALAISTVALLFKLALDIGYISTESNINKITIRKLFKNVHINNTEPYEYWWNYGFQSGSIQEDLNLKNESNSRSNLVIVNLVLKNTNMRIAFKESIMLDTRHPNDAIYLEEFNTINHHVFCVQRVDKLMQFLETHLDQNQFAIQEDFIK